MGATWQPWFPAPAGGVIDACVFSPGSDASFYAIGDLVPFLASLYVPGAFRSTRDGGASWQDHASVQGVGSVHGIAFDPSNLDIVYAVSGPSVGGVILRSSDGGASWKKLPLPSPLAGRVTAMLVNPGNSSRASPARCPRSTSTSRRTRARPGPRSTAGRLTSAR